MHHGRQTPRTPHRAPRQPPAGFARVPRRGRGARSKRRRGVGCSWRPEGAGAEVGGRVRGGRRVWGQWGRGERAAEALGSGPRWRRPSQWQCAAITRAAAAESHFVCAGGALCRLPSVPRTAVAARRARLADCSLYRVHLHCTVYTVTDHCIVLVLFVVGSTFVPRRTKQTQIMLHGPKTKQPNQTKHGPWRMPMSHVAHASCLMGREAQTV